MTKEDRPFLKELNTQAAGTDFYTWCLLRKKEKRIARANGNPFLSLEIADKTQTAFVTVFSDHPLYDKIAQFEVGSILKIGASVDFYKSRLSPKILKAVPLPKEEWSEEIQSRLIKSSKYDPNVMYAEVQEIVHSLQDPTLKSILTLILEQQKEDFCQKPAARGIHHAFRCGLLEHTLSMLKVAEKLLPHYSMLNRDCVLAGILLHDMGKTQEYSGEIDNERTREGILKGHGYIGSHQFDSLAQEHQLDTEMRTQIVHIILSHHRLPEWGALVRPATPEALFVCMIDGMDSLMGIVDTAREEHGNLDRSPFLPAIDNYLIWPDFRPTPQSPPEVDTLPV